MKKTKLLLGIALIGLVGVFSACEEEETTEPTINITESTVPDSVEAGVEATLEFSVIADEKLEQIELRKGTKTLDTKTEGFTDKSADNYTYTGVLADTAEAESSLQMALIATDNKENTKTYDFEIYVKKIVIEGDSISTYKDVTIGSISWNTTDPTYYAVATNTTYKHDDGDAYKSDLGYIYGSTHEATIFAPDWDELNDLSQGPDESGWNSERATRFKATDMTTSEFDAIPEDFDSDFVIDNAASGASDEYVDHLQVGGANEDVDVIAFVTEDDKKGLIKIKSFEEGSDSDHPDGSGTMTFDVKVQK